MRQTLWIGLVALTSSILAAPIEKRIVDVGKDFDESPTPVKRALDLVERLVDVVKEFDEVGTPTIDKREDKPEQSRKFHLQHLIYLPSVLLKIKLTRFQLLPKILSTEVRRQERDRRMWKSNPRKQGLQQ